MRALSLLAGLALTVALVGCTDDNSKYADNPPETATSSSTPRDTPTSSASEAVRYTEDQLRESLLTLDDMPEAGFTISEVDESRERTYYCDYQPPVDPTEVVTSEFEKTEGLSFFLVRSNVDQFASADDARAQIDKAAEVLETCREGEIDGTKQTYAVMSAPKLGEETLAVKIEMTIDGIDVVMHQFYVLSGTALLQTSAAVGGMAFPDADVSSDLTKTQFEKYQALSK
jgi:hypothetical protein